MLTVAIQQFWYPNTQNKTILHGIDFTLDKGHHLAVLGESGCGKSTLLHIIYGLLHLNKGVIRWDEKIVLGPNHNLVPGESFMKLVAQEFNVMPFISVAENIATHLSRKDAEEDNNRVDELLAVVALEAFKNVKARNLSGGQKQRVALAKALANAPELILLDEPFSNIDTFRKNKLRRKLYGYLKKQNIACITATHESQEALSFADKILILNQGTIEAIGTPQKVYHNLQNEYQASFFGPVSKLPKHTISENTSRTNTSLLPHQLYISEIETSLQGTVIKSYFKGAHFEIEISTNQGVVFVQHPFFIKHNSEVYIALKDTVN